jgi:hypothetical protein
MMHALSNSKLRYKAVVAEWARVRRIACAYCAKPLTRKIEMMAAQLNSTPWKSRSSVVALTALPIRYAVAVTHVARTAMRPKLTT